jgi:hypothetical protein
MFFFGGGKPRQTFMKIEDCISFRGCNHDTVPLLDGPNHRRKARLDEFKRVEQACKPAYQCWVRWASAPEVPQRLKPPYAASNCSAKALLYPKFSRSGQIAVDGSPIIPLPGHAVAAKGKSLCPSP